MPITDYQYPVFQPAVRNITAITNDFPALVTTDIVHSYVTGTIVQLYVPSNFGMIFADQFMGPIIVTSPTQFTIPLDSTTMDPFVIPPLVELPLVLPDDTPVYVQAQYAQAVPCGELTSQLTAAVQNVLPYTHRSE